jgi:hypothetical protein
VVNVSVQGKRVNDCLFGKKTAVNLDRDGRHHDRSITTAPLGAMAREILVHLRRPLAVRATTIKIRMSAAASTASSQSGTPKNVQPDDGSSDGQADDVPVLPVGVGVATAMVGVGGRVGASVGTGRVGVAVCCGTRALDP